MTPRLAGYRGRLTVRREYLPKVPDPALDPTPEEAARRLVRAVRRRPSSGSVVPVMEQHRAFLASVIEVG